MQNDSDQTYRCNLCRVIATAVLATAIGLLIVLLQEFMPVALLIVILVLLAMMAFVMIENHCKGLAIGSTGLEDSALTVTGPDGGISPADVAVRAGSAPAEIEASSKAARAAVEKAATALVAEEKVAAEKAEADKAAAQKMAADRVAAEKAAAKKAKVDKAAAEKAEADRVAAETAKADKVAAAKAAPQKVADEKARDEAARASEAARAAAAGEKDFDQDGTVEGSFEGRRPQALEGPRDGTADDLKRIKGIGPKLEQLCNSLGFYHFDQIAGWSVDEIAWVDANLEGFKGRVTRDQWVAQAGTLAAGGETDFSKRVDDGDVPSSQ